MVLGDRRAVAADEHERRRHALGGRRSRRRAARSSGRCPACRRASRRARPGWPARRSASGWRPGWWTRAARRRRSAAAGGRAARRGTRAGRGRAGRRPAASSIPSRIANATAHVPLKISAIATPPPSSSTPAPSWRTPGRACSIAASRSASAGRVRPARRAAAKTATCAIRMPPPNAATSGIHDVPGREAGRDRAVVGHDVHDRGRQRPTGEQAERAGDDRDDQRLAGDQPPHLVRRGAERAQHRDLAAALHDRQRERPGDDEQRDASRRSRPSSRRSPPARPGRRRADRSRRRRPHGRGRAPSTARHEHKGTVPLGSGWRSR